MKTRDKDFTGCHPEIAEALKNGKEIKCFLWDNHEMESEAKVAWVIAYKATGLYKYQTKGRYYTNAKPVKTKKIVKPFYELVEQLKKEGYCAKRGPKGGFYLSNSNEPPGYYNMSMLCDCGRDEEESMFAWPEKDLMEVEE